MKPLTQRKADVSSEPIRDDLELLMDNDSAVTGVDKKFYKNYATIGERLLAAGHEEDFNALRAIEDCYYERCRIGFNILVEVFTKGTVPDELLAESKRLLPENEYRFLKDTLGNYINLSMGKETTTPSSES